MNKERLTQAELISQAAPEMAPLLKAGFGFMEINVDPVVVMWGSNETTGATRTELISKAAKALSASFWGSGAGPGASHVEAMFQIFDSPTMEDMGYSVSQISAGVDKEGFFRVSTTVARFGEADEFEQVPR